jgi:pilus assembly protein CpaF
VSDTCLDALILPFFREIGLESYVTDPEVSELMITTSRVFVERAGEMVEVSGAAINERRLRACVEIIGQAVGDSIDDYSKPWLDSRLPDGSRVAATYPPISPEGVVLTIRRFIRHFTTDELIERGAMTRDVCNMILGAVAQRKNILVSGGTSTGKTTVTNAFVRHIPIHERIIVIEKPIEMKILHPNRVRFESYPPLGDRAGVSVSDILSLTLRHRPDRIIVGEVKDADAAYGLLQAMNTGHDGTFSTIHANTAHLALTRLAGLALPGFGNLQLARQETAAAIDMVIEVTRKPNGWRGINCVLKVDDYDDRTSKFQTTECYRHHVSSLT